jgi:hypothetical protein
MAQFSHPDLGGRGQWSAGGMTMIGDMFNDALKTKVKQLCSELASILSQETSTGSARGTSPLGQGDGNENRPRESRLFVRRWKPLQANGGEPTWGPQPLPVLRIIFAMRIFPAHTAWQLTLAMV